MRKKNYGYLTIAVILLWQLSVSSALAFDFEVDRIRLDLTLDEPVQGMRIKNNSTKTPVNLQVSAMSWKQENGKDIYAPTNDLIIAPSVMTIPPTRAQIMRVGWRTPAPLTSEIAYRIYVQQLNAAALTTRIGVQFKLSLGVPIFIKPSQPVYQYSWGVRRSSNGYSVTLQNSGNVHLQITKFDLLDGQNRSVATYNTPYYVLAKQAVTVQVPSSGAGGGVARISASTDYQPLVSEVNVS